MSESLDREFEAQELEEGSNAVTKNAKPGEKIDTSKGGAAKVIDVTTDSLEGAKGTKNAGSSAARSVSHEGSKSLATKPSGASAKQEEVETDEYEETITETEYDFTEDVDALVAGEELSEEFRERAVTIFEAAVTSKVNAEVAALQEAFESTLTEEVEKIKTELAEKVDDYLTYAAQSWIEENTLQIEHGIKSDIAESFFNGLKDLFMEHNVGVPEEKFNLLDGLAVELDEMEGKLNEQIDANIALNKQLGEFVKMEIVNECATGLAETQKEKKLLLLRVLSLKLKKTLELKSKRSRNHTSLERLKQSILLTPPKKLLNPLSKAQQAARWVNTSMRLLAGPNN